MADPRGIGAGSVRSLGLVLAGVLLSAATIDAAEIYKWRDDKGIVHYSNTPPPQGTDASVLDENKGKVSVVPAYRAPDGAADGDAALQDRVRRLERQLEQERTSQQQTISPQADADAYARWRADCLAQRRTDCDDPGAAAVPVYGYPAPPAVVRPPGRPVRPSSPSGAPPGYTVGPGPGGIGGQYVPNPPRPRPNPSEPVLDPRPIPTPR